MHKYPTSFQATDAVIFKKSGNANVMLLGRKKFKKKYRFIGGFVDPEKDKSLEQANRRECYEEAGTNLECSDPKYLFSFRVDDPRYRDSVDKIMSAVFLREYVYGTEKAGDDIKEVVWFSRPYVRKYYKEVVVKEHWPLVEELIRRNIL